jgi:CheY-like chemotaxis protein
MEEPRGTVLVVDDSLSARVCVRDAVLDSFPRWKVEVATNADDALAQTARSPVFDYMLIDGSLPGRDGVSLAIEMRERYPSVHIGLITANIQPATRDLAARHGFTFIPKPITEDRARAFFNGVLERRKHA